MKAKFVFEGLNILAPKSIDDVMPDLHDMSNEDYFWFLRKHVAEKGEGMTLPKAKMILTKRPLTKKWHKKVIEDVLDNMETNDILSSTERNPSEWKLEYLAKQNKYLIDLLTFLEEQGPAKSKNKWLSWLQK